MPTPTNHHVLVVKSRNRFTLNRHLEKEARNTLDKLLYSIRVTTPQRDIVEYRQCSRPCMV